ncbi:hypothetical protein [Janthinobacterium sp. 17J80-10]|uniref:hypothetical protein n=1 Tax=Janthinobacterium sp. 17J80-10 TaxID=2497863 RepID=UPI0010054B70|nr:hypothetical protein [Janthinobacterium sp. 17J80-10]QAU33325.1 hypothetical protein EKL02_03525 [Janthinobacterium sp. 17J80-10]
MTLKQWLAAGALASLPFAAAAQQVPPQPNPRNANAPVPAPAYNPAFNNYRSMADEQPAPDTTWRAANDEVGRLGGHGGHARGDADVAPATSAPAKTAPMHQGHRH